MTLLAAQKMDTVGNKKAAREIAMIKVIAPNMCEKVVDYAEQGKIIFSFLFQKLSITNDMRFSTNFSFRTIEILAHGGMGLCQDTPLPFFRAQARALRLADGPDEVHVRAVSRLEKPSE